MYAKFLYNAGCVPYTPESAVSSGDIIAVAGGAGVATYPIAAGATGVLATEGVFEVTNGHADFNAGDPVYWDSSNHYTVTDSSKIFMGYAVAASAGSTSSAPTVTVALTPRAKFTALTDNSGGTASGTIAAIGASYSQSEVANAIASLAAANNKR